MRLYRKDGSEAAICREGSRGAKKALFAQTRNWVQPAVRIYPNGPQNEKERQWRLNRKEFIRSVIRKEE